MTSETAILAGGCFWCLEAVYEQLRGVQSVESGYIGGTVANPSYESVCSGRTGHAEAIRITYDPAQLSFNDLLDVFFTIHDPTTLNRQGGDVGTQYRSAVFTLNEAQAQATREKIAALTAEKLWDDPIVTQVTPASTWYGAEGYHQEYFTNNPTQGYCRAVIAPKVAKFRKAHIQRLKA